MENSLFWLVPLNSILALAFAYYFYNQMMKENEGTDRMKQMLRMLGKERWLTLSSQYKVVGIFFIIMTILFSFLAFFNVQNGWDPFAFISGGFF
jgi:K(+)-stimulated pyrophosphate-energized sodium pump